MTTPTSSTPSFSFNLSLSLHSLNPSKLKTFGPRLGTILFRRSPNESSQITLPTPTFITTTSRGVVPHLPPDNVRRTPAIRWVNVPFETFMEHNPPIPTIHPPSPKGALHAFLGFDPRKQIVSLTARDPADGREMPPNGNAVVNVWTLRGVRKLTPSDWQTYALKCQPDIVFALSDTPFTDPVDRAYSQKRLTKSIERTAAWLSVMLRSWAPENDKEKAKKKGSKTKTDPNLISSFSNLQPPSNTALANTKPSAQAPLPNVNLPPPFLPPIFLPMAGGSSSAARLAFASSLLEPLYGPEAEAMKHRELKTLDEGVAGYSFDLVPLRGEGTTPTPENTNRQPLKRGAGIEDGKLETEIAPPSTTTDQNLPSASYQSVDFIPLIQASLAPLPPTKPRLINSTDGPHEILRCITEVGVDIFDAAWAQRLAGWGVGLDFEFPSRGDRNKKTADARPIGHNLYNSTFEFDFGTIADAFRGASTSNSESEDDDRSICTCAACSPVEEQGQILHGVDSAEYTCALVSDQNGPLTVKKHHTRAYIHHLLQTHEMGAHTLLAMHNLMVLDRFFEGVRDFLGSLSGDGDRNLKSWMEEVDWFCRAYDEAGSREMFERARRDWRDVDLARGKGRLAREKEAKEGEILN